MNVFNIDVCLHLMLVAYWARSAGAKSSQFSLFMAEKYCSLSYNFLQIHPYSFKFLPANRAVSRLFGNDMFNAKSTCVKQIITPMVSEAVRWLVSGLISPTDAGLL